MKFIISLLVTLFILFFTIDLGLLNISEKNVTRKSFLASNIHSKKIIIDSGSNGLFGFNSSIIESHFKLPVINLSDMAGVPLNHKISRIKSISKEGDIVILPLEYNYYYSDNIDQNYIIEFFFKYSHYYKYFSLFDKYKFFINFNFGSFFNFGLKKINESFIFSKHNRNSVYSAVNYLLDSQKFSLHGDYLNRPTEFDVVGEQNETRLILNSLIYDSMLSLSENLLLLSTLVDHGVELYVTWPAVTSLQKDCILKNLPFLEILKHQLSCHGLNVIGTPSDFIFDRSLFGYDTPYHLSVDGANLRTNKLISLLGDKITSSDSHNSVLKQLCSIVAVDFQNKSNLNKSHRQYSLKSYEFENLDNKSFCKLSKVIFSITPMQYKDNYLIMVNPSDEYILYSHSKYTNSRISDFIFYINPQKSLVEVNFDFYIMKETNNETSFDFEPIVYRTKLSLNEVTMVYNLYQSYLNRDPDISGFLNYLDAFSCNSNFDKLKSDFMKGAANELKNL